MRNLVIVLGDQLSEEASALVDFDSAQDAVWMAEVDEESTHIISSKQRTTLFLSAMRHFAKELKGKGWSVRYSEIDSANNTTHIGTEKPIGKAQYPLYSGRRFETSFRMLWRQNY